METVMKMKPLAVLLFGLSAAPAFCQESKPETPAPAPASAAPAKAPAPAPAGPSQEDLEAKFIATLTEATMSGRWCMLKDGSLGPDRDEKYVISGVEKTGGSNWIISARIQYGAANFVAPVPVQVKWAGDTAVIIVDNIGFPGTNKYSARVMIYSDTYSGTWSGGDHGGMLHGVITRGKAEEKPAPAAPAKEEKKP